jgi:hypothetical protein
MSTENEIRAASASFYAALNRMAKGEAGAMESVWSHSAEVTSRRPATWPTRSASRPARSRWPA